jgi:iron complex outermembrane receptor protein
VGQDLTFLPGAVGLDGTTRYAGFYTSFAQHEDYVNISSSSVSLKDEQDLQFARFVSISAYQESAFRTRFDQDSTPLNVVDAFWHQPAESFSEELQLLSPESSKVQWIGGLFYFNQRTAFPFHLEGLAAYPFTDLSIYYDDRLTSMAGFGQATVEVLPETHVTAGLRYTTDRHDVTGATYGDSFLLESATPSAKFDKLTWRFVLDHQFTPDVLGYISDNRGFKAGGFNQQQYALPPVKPEVLDAYEAGFKTQFLDRRLRVNFAGYDYNYKDVQVNVYPAGSLEVINGAAAQIYGVDGDVAGALTNNFTLQTGVSWIHGRYTSFPDCPSYVPAPAGGNTQITIDCTGRTTAHSPGFTGDVGAEYRMPTSVGELSYNLTFSYSTGYYPDPDNRIRQPHTTLVHPSVLWTSLDKKFNVRVWADNLLNEHYYQFLTAQATGDIGSPSAPRTYGVTAGIHF